MPLPSTSYARMSLRWRLLSLMYRIFSSGEKRQSVRIDEVAHDHVDLFEIGRDAIHAGDVQLGRVLGRRQRRPRRRIARSRCCRPI